MKKKLELDLNALDAADARYMEKFRDVAREHLRDYVEAVTYTTPQAERNAYICPACKSGTGNNGKFTPGFFIFRTKQGELNYKCHACGITGDIFDLAGLMNGTSSWMEKQKIVAGFLGIDLDKRTALDELSTKDRHVADPPSEVKTITLKQAAADYIKESQRLVHMTDFYQSRGLTQETIERFNLGYDPMRNQAVIPFTSTYYMTRNASVKADAKGDNKHRKPKGLKQPLYNFPAIAKKREPVFLTEAPLDALSIIQMGGNAMALGGSTTSALRRILNIYQPGASTFFVLTFDSDGAGMRLTESVAKILTGFGIPYSIPLHPAFTEYKDANAALMSDPELLAAGIEAERARALELWSHHRDIAAFPKVTYPHMRKRRS